MPVRIWAVSRATSRARSIARIGIALAGIAIVPLAWRPVFGAWAPETARATPSYIPALEPARAREPFDPRPIEELRAFPPGLVVIGDSMTGRIQKRRLEQLSGEIVARILRNATGVRPKAVIVFFRETNLTDPMFRLGDPYRVNADPLSHDFEPELNAAVASRTQGAWFRVHSLVDRTYRIEQTRRWLEPELAAVPARMVSPAPGSDLLSSLNSAFALDRLRAAQGADMAAVAGEPLDFHRDVNRSVLPAFLALAREQGMRLIFVRILRRPSMAARPQRRPHCAATSGLSAYLEAGGAIFRDDRDYPGMAALPHDDGDHISRAGMVPYTELFYEQMAQHLR